MLPPRGVVNRAPPRSYNAPSTHGQRPREAIARAPGFDVVGQQAKITSHEKSELPNLRVDSHALAVKIASF